MAERTLEFHYIKSNSFKVVHCDGVWGGATPRGLISISFFSERNPIPKTVSHARPEQGQPLGEEISRKAKGGIIREVDVAVIMDLQMAKSLNE